jgi:hypothetical protein
MFLWFKENMDQSINVYSRAELASLCNVYIQRNNETIQEIRKNQRPGRPLAPKEQLMVDMANKEAKEAVRGALGT